MAILSTEIPNGSMPYIALDQMVKPSVSYDGKWTGWTMNTYTSYIDYDLDEPCQIATPFYLYWECLLMTSGVLYVAPDTSYVADVWGIGGGGNAILGNPTLGGYSGKTGLCVGLALTGNVAVSIGAPTSNTMYGATIVATGGKTTDGGSANGGGVNGNVQGRIISRFYDQSKNTEYGAGGIHASLPIEDKRLGGGGFMDFTFFSNSNASGRGYGAGGGVYNTDSTFSGISGCLLVRVPAQ